MRSLNTLVVLATAFTVALSSPTKNDVSEAVPFTPDADTENPTNGPSDPKLILSNVIDSENGCQVNRSIFRNTTMYDGKCVLIDTHVSHVSFVVYTDDDCKAFLHKSDK